ncbi:MAG: hypothetical protein L0Z50_34960 [Verrucomicrobiales bacterium]|nr:hypothetical protein [Verrucomicrobiales bacterium]
METVLIVAVHHDALLPFEVGRELVLLAQRRQFMPNELVGLLRERRPLVKHPPIFFSSVRVLQRSA